MALLKKKTKEKVKEEPKEIKPKKKKKEKGPEYCTSLLNTQVINYREYYMSKQQKLLFTVVSFIAGAAVAYLMYGGLGSDADGNPRPITHVLNIVICTAVGFGAVKFIIPLLESSFKIKRRNDIRRQFMDLLDALAASVASGSNAIKAFEAAKEDLVLQYGEDSIIVQELTLILDGQKNFIDISASLIDFGKRSGIKEIESFAQVFELSHRKGGDFSKVIRDSYEILYSKINIEMEIETKIAATRNELNIMLAMPFILVGMMKSMSPDFAYNFRTPTGALGITVGLVIVVISYLLGRKITSIEV